MNKSKQFTNGDHFPSCVPDTTYGVTQFWAEEYWAWRQIQKIRKNYPGIDFNGLINSTFEDHFKQLLNNPPHTNILGTNSFTDIPDNSWKISNKKLTLATSHAPSRYKAQLLLRRHKDNFRIITFDAHLDLGNYTGIHGAWLTENIAKRTSIIGGWADTFYELNYAHSLVPHIASELTELSDDNSFLEWIAEKKVYISIDIDYLQPTQNYLGLSSYWHRILLIGHTRNLNQQIQMLPDHIDLTTPTLIGKEINLFEDLALFRERKKKSINLHIKKLEKLFEEISILLNDSSSSLLGLDLVEYSAICDWKKLTLNALLQNYSPFERVLKPVYEE